MPRVYQVALPGAIRSVHRVDDDGVLHIWVRDDLTRAQARAEAERVRLLVDGGRRRRLAVLPVIAVVEAVRLSRDHPKHAALVGVAVLAVASVALVPVAFTGSSEPQVEAGGPVKPPVATSPAPGEPSSAPRPTPTGRPDVAPEHPMDDFSTPAEAVDAPKPRRSRGLVLSSGGLSLLPALPTVSAPIRPSVVPTPPVDAGETSAPCVLRVVLLDGVEVKICL